MSSLNEAAELDARNRAWPAVTAYRAAIVHGEADLDAYLDYAVLLFECADEGYASSQGIPVDFSATAVGRAHEILDQAESRYGTHPEIEFWRRYFRRIYEAGDDFFAEAARLVETGETNVPYFYLISGPTAHTFVDPARRLLKAVENGETSRKRYVRSVLQSSIHDRVMGR